MTAFDKAWSVVKISPYERAVAEQFADQGDMAGQIPERRKTPFHEWMENENARLAAINEAAGKKPPKSRRSWIERMRDQVRGA